MYSKIIINIILILALVIIQMSFISGLPSGLNNLNLMLVILIFILILIDLNLAVWWAVGIGVLFSIFSFEPFGINLICLSTTVVIANFLLTNFFTDRSLYSLFALVGSATLVYEFFLNVIGFLSQLISGREVSIILDTNFWTAKLSQLILNLLATLIIFYLVNFVSKRLKPVFLIKHK